MAVNGKHYSKTLEAWLQKQDLNQDKIKALFKKLMEKRAPYGYKGGASFTWRALNYLPIKTALSGWSCITDSLRNNDTMKSPQKKLQS